MCDWVSVAHMMMHNDDDDHDDDGDDEATWLKSNTRVEAAHYFYRCILTISLFTKNRNDSAFCDNAYFTFYVWIVSMFYIFNAWHHLSGEEHFSKSRKRRSVLNAERIRVQDFGIFDQAQVQDRESSHYGLWQISLRLER